MIKFGIRQNLFYPLMFISFIFARRIMKHLIENEDHNNFKCPFLLVLLMFVSEIIISVIIYFKNQRGNDNETKTACTSSGFDHDAQHPADTDQFSGRGRHDVGRTADAAHRRSKRRHSHVDQQHHGGIRRHHAIVSGR